MAEIKNFNRNQFLIKNKKTETNNKMKQEDSVMLDSMIKRHKTLRIYRICAIVAAIGIIAVIIYFRWINMEYTDYIVKQEYDWTRSSETQSINLQNTMVAYSKDGMSCTDSKGKVIWNQTYEMQNPIVRTCKNVIAIGDYNGRKIYISDTTGNVGNIDTTMPIRDFCVSANGIVAAILNDTTVTAIYLYSADTGEALAYFKTTMSKSGYPIALAISDDGARVAVSYLKVEDGHMTTSIGFYNFSSVGQNYTDNLVGGYGYADSVVPFVKFMNNDTVIAVADNRLMFYQGKQKPGNIQDIILSEEIQSIFYSDNYIGLVFFDSTGENTYKMDIYDTSGTKCQELKFSIDYKDIILEEQSIIVYNETECLIYDWNGRKKYDGEFKESIACIIPVGSISKYTFVTNNSIQTVQFN